ncbi:MAG: PEGA domain-containing protein [Acidilobus sp.]
MSLRGPPLVALIAVLVISSLGFVTFAGASAHAIDSAAPQPLSVGEGGVLLCYPYLVEANGLVNLQTGSAYSLWPGDVAVKASCSQGYILVVGLNGAYLISTSSTPSVVKFAELALRSLIGVFGDSAAYFVNGTVVVIAPGQDYAILPPPLSDPISFTVNTGVPEVLLYQPANGTFELEFPVSAIVPLSISSGYPSGFVNGSQVFVQASNGTLFEFTVVPYSRPTLTASYSIPIDFSKMYVANPNYVIGLTDVGVALVELQYPPLINVLGNVNMTPVGYYAYLLNTTYVYIHGSWVPVPGYAIGTLGQLAVMTDQGSRTMLYPLFPTQLEAGVSVSGYLEVGNYYVKISLAPGSYALPSPSVLEMTGMSIQLMGGYEAFPFNVTYPSKPVVLVFPSSLAGLETITGVDSVSSGDGGLLLLRPSYAEVMTESGEELEIPGSWLYGGLGPAGVALYANGTIFVFNYQGAEVASYPALISYVPLVLSPYELGGRYYVVVEGPGAPGNGTFYIFGPSGVTSFQAALRLIDVGTGVSVVYSFGGNSGYIEADPITIPIEVQRLSGAVNGLTVVYRTPSGNYVLDDLQTGAQYVLLDAPSLPVYPLGPDSIAVFDSHTGALTIINLTQLMESELSITVLSTPMTYIYVNNTLAGVGSAVAYAPYGATLNITAYRPYTIPSTTIVHLTGPLTLSLTPVPLVANVSLHVVSPIPVNYVTADVNGSSVTWYVNKTIQLTAGVPYVITITSTSPLNYCSVTTTETTFLPGSEVLTYNCTLRLPVLELVSALPATVVIATASGPITTLNVTPGIPQYVAVTPGTYTIASSTTVSGRAPLSKVVTLKSPGLYPYNVTPPPISLVGILTAYSNVPYANVSILFENGTMIASHIGSLSLSLKPGIYMVRVSAPGYVNATKYVSLSAGATLNVLVPLTPYSPPKRVLPLRRLIVVGGAVGATAAAAGLGFVIYRRSRMAPEEVQI